MERIGVIGGGRFGTTLALELAQRGVDVIFLDRNRDIVQRMSGVVAKAVQGDASDMDALADAGFTACDTVVVALGHNVEASILATMSLKDLRIPRVVSKASTDVHGKVLERVGADMIVYPERDYAIRLARTLSARSVVDYIEVDKKTGIVEIVAPPSFVDKSLAETGIRTTYGLTVLAIRRARPGQPPETVSVPSGTDRIESGDVLVLFGPEANLRQIEESLT